MARIRRRSRGVRGGRNMGVGGVKPRGGIRGTVKFGGRGIRRHTDSYGATTGFGAISHDRTKEVNLWARVVPRSEDSGDGVDNGSTKEDDALQRDLVRARVVPDSEDSGDGVEVAPELAIEVSDLAPEVVPRLQRLLADVEPILHDVIS